MFAPLSPQFLGPGKPQVCLGWRSARTRTAKANPKKNALPQKIFYPAVLAHDASMSPLIALTSLPALLLIHHVDSAPMLPPTDRSTRSPVRNGPAVIFSGLPRPSIVRAHPAAVVSYLFLFVTCNEQRIQLHSRRYKPSSRICCHLVGNRTHSGLGGWNVNFTGNNGQEGRKCVFLCLGPGAPAARGRPEQDFFFRAWNLLRLGVDAHAAAFKEVRVGILYSQS